MSSRQVRYWLKDTRKDAHLRLVNIAVRRNEYHQITAWNTRWEVDNDAQMLVTMWRDKHPTIHKLADVFGKEAIGDVVCDYSTTAIYNLKICDEQDQLPLMDKPHDYPVRGAEMKPWEEQ